MIDYAPFTLRPRAMPLPLLGNHVVMGYITSL